MILDAIETPHSLEPVCILTGQVEDPAQIVNVDFKLIGSRLFDRVTLKSGKLVQIEYFRNYDSQTGEYSDLAVRELNNYHFNEANTILHRESVYIWYNSDRSELARKESVTFYNGFERKQEGKSRRSRIIDHLMEGLENLFASIGQTEAGNGLLSSLSEVITKYEVGDTDPLVQTIAALPAQTGLDALPALDGNGTLRQYLIRELTINQPIISL